MSSLEGPFANKLVLVIGKVPQLLLILIDNGLTTKTVTIAKLQEWWCLDKVAGALLSNFQVN